MKTFLQEFFTGQSFPLFFAFPCVRFEVVHSLQFITVKEKLIMALRRGKKKKPIERENKGEKVYILSRSVVNYLTPSQPLVAHDTTSAK